MSETQPIDPATEALRDRVRQLEGDILLHTRRLEVTTACRDELAEIIAALCRKARLVPRKARGTAPTPAPAEVSAEPRPSIFSVVPPAIEATPEAIAEAG
jgi:hypothetical protein